MVRAQAIKSKGAYDERVHEESHPTLENIHKREKDMFEPVRGTLVDVDIVLVTIGDINISRDIIGYPKAGQGHFRRKKVRIAHSETLRSRRD